jgi:hypothetical protein
MCPATVPDLITGDLGPNQWIVASGPDGLFFDTFRKGKGRGGRDYTLEDTRGCSCFQILDELNSRGYPLSMADEAVGADKRFDGHMKKGCSPGIMNVWLHVVANGELPPMEPAAGKGKTAAQTEFALEAAYPNPFNPSTTLTFEVPEAAQVRVTVYDVLGRRVRELANGMLSEGIHRVSFDASDLPSGTYLVRFEHPKGATTQVLQLLK